MNHSMHQAIESADASTGGGLSELLFSFFTGSPWFMPHGHCYLWTPGLVGLHVVSDTLIGAAYVLISLVLYALVRRIRLPFGTMIVAFGVFIGACGLTHFMEVWNVWHSAYWLAGGVKAITALASVATGIFLVKLRPTVVEVANAAQLSEHRRRELEEKNQELETLYARLREADELKTQFFANVSHELRTPLALILGPVERLLGQQALPADSRRDLEVVERNARLLLKHVNALLDAAKLEAGAMRPSYAQVDLSSLVRRVSSNFEVLARENDITLAVDVPRLLPAQVDPEKLERVLLNLLSNAFKFTPRSGQVRCALVAHGEQVRLVVEDTGPGIPENHREAIFERFRQLEEGEGRRGGTGLGLAISRDFVHLHGGRLWAEAAEKGGARFIAELPLAAPAGASVGSWSQHVPPAAKLEAQVVTEDTRAEALSTPGARTTDPGAPLVLVVEDTADLRHFVADTLGREFRVIEAEDGLVGLHQAEVLRPDVIVTDIMMPRMGGDALVREVRARSELDAIPILLLSARADDELRVRLLREGAQDYLVKPFLSAELAARVHNLATLKRTRDVLSSALQARSEDLEAMARELALRMHQREDALAAAQAARAEAERSSEFKATLLRLVAHELRTPLTVLRLDMHLLQRQRETLSEPHRRLIDKLERGSLRLEHLVESVLAYVRLEAGELKVRFEEVDVTTLAREVVEQHRPQAQRQLLALELRAPPGPVPVCTDGRAVQLVLTQLVLNALKYTQRGSVEVRVEPSDEACQLAVVDTGRGIAPEDHARIFEPFEQLEAPEVKSSAGLGLGLSLVRQLVEALGGRVQLQSAPGQGSTFTVVLPARPPHQG